MEVDAKWVQHSYTNALVINVKIANSVVHKMLVDNGNAINIIFSYAYQKIRLTGSDLSPMTSPLYEFTKDHVIPKGTIMLAIILGDHPGVRIVVTKFLVIEYPLAFNGVIGRLLLKAVTLIQCLIMKFTTTIQIGQVRGK